MSDENKERLVKQRLRSLTLVIGNTQSADWGLFGDVVELGELGEMTGHSKAKSVYGPRQT